MAPRPRFSLLARKKQDTILDSAADEFGTYGYDGASINRIIKTAGISKGVAYYYFDDKKDLFATVIEHSFEKIVSMFGDLDLESWDADNFWDELEALGHNGLVLFRDQEWVRRAARLFWNYFDTHPDSVAVRGVWATVHNSIENIIDRGQTLGVIRTDIPKSLLVSMFFGLGTAIERWLLDFSDELSSEEFDQIDAYLTSVHRLLAEVPPQKTKTKKTTGKTKIKKVKK